MSTDRSDTRPGGPSAKNAHRVGAPHHCQSNQEVTIMDERIWTGLSPAQADGLACVICAHDFRIRGSVSVPVGRSHTGSQVFACVDRCARAAAEGPAGAPGEPSTGGGR